MRWPACPRRKIAPVREAVRHVRQTGWAHVPFDPDIYRWANHARTVAARAVADPGNAHWLRSGGTWFVGVNLLDNDPTGRLPGGPPLQGAVTKVIAALGLGDLPLDRAQISVTYPGYPRQDPDESDTAFAFRRDRCAAHMDGLLATGADRRRMAGERHGYILGLPLTEASAGGAPLTVWEGSHAILRAAIRKALEPVPMRDWPVTDLTEVYTAARREAFDTCPRIAVPAAPGEATLIDRFTLHGIAPWERGADAAPEGRMIAYFRPECPLARWFG